LDAEASQPLELLMRKFFCPACSAELLKPLGSLCSEGRIYCLDCGVSIEPAALNLAAAESAVLENSLRLPAAQEGL
jgi:transcription elongation factor Elf1